MSAEEQEEKQPGEETKKRDIIVFYDSPCIDGAAAAWAVNEGLKGEDALIEFIPIGFGKPEERKNKVLEQMRDGAEVIFVDTAPKDITLDALLKPDKGDAKIARLTIIDHHASEVQRLNTYKASLGKRKKSNPVLELCVDANKPSAAVLAWEKYNEGDHPKLFDMLGRMEPPVSLRNNREEAIASYIDSKDITSSTEQAFKTIDELVETEEAKMAADGGVILNDQLNNTKGLRANIRYTKLELLPGVTEWMPIVNANVQNFGRRINQFLLEQASAGTTCGVIGAWMAQGDGSVKMSLRTTGIPNAGDVAKHLANTIAVGGGGHGTDSVVQFENLEQFVENVKTYTREEMMEERWGHTQDIELGQHTARVASQKRGGRGRASGE